MSNINLKSIITKVALMYRNNVNYREIIKVVLEKDLKLDEEKTYAINSLLNKIDSEIIIDSRGITIPDTLLKTITPDLLLLISILF